MSKIEAKLESTESAFHVRGYEKIEYDLTYVDGIFSTHNSQLVDCYLKFGRYLAIIGADV